MTVSDTHADTLEQLEQALTALDLMGKHTEAGDEQNCPCCTATATARKHARALVVLFVDLRGDWSDNRGPCREGFEIIDAALSAGSAPSKVAACGCSFRPGATATCPHGNTLAALSAGGRKPTPEVVWVVERGQPENQFPSVWLTLDGRWVTNVNQAERFRSKKAAEFVIKNRAKYALEGAPPLAARAVEYEWVDWST